MDLIMIKESQNFLEMIELMEIQHINTIILQKNFHLNKIKN